MELVVREEKVILLPERALYWPARATLIVADLHWGKDASFRASGIPVPSGSLAADLERLDSALSHTGARRLLILGDLIHARTAQQSRATFAVIRDWRQRWANLWCTLVRGNHDRASGDPPADLGVEVVDQLHEGPFLFRHHPGISEAAYTLAGHLHPGIKLSGRGDRVRLPCFHFSPGCGILPAFGSFTGWATPEVGPDDRVFVIGEGEVHEIPRREPSTRNC